MNKLLINTPQNVKFEYHLASVGNRCIAFAIDYGIILLYFIVIYVILDQVGVMQWLDNWATFGIVSLFMLPGFFYPFIFETAFEGQTVGKRLMKIKVVKIDGTHATVYQYFIRWISNIVDVFLSTGGLGLAAIILTKNSQRVGDLAADTAVISVKENLKLRDTLFEELVQNYVVTYHEVMNLSDRDINEIKEVYKIAYSRKNFQIILALSARIETILGIKAQVAPEDFIAIIIKDHYSVYREM